MSSQSYYSPLTTQDPSYILPLKPRIQIQSKDGSTTFYDYNAHETPQPSINITNLTVELALGQAGTFDMGIEDADGIIDRKLINLGCKVKVAIGKSEDAMFPLNTFYCRKFATYVDAANNLRYAMHGYGAQVITNERIVDVQKMAQRDSLGDFTPNVNDSSMLAYRLFKSIFEDVNIMTLKKPPTLLQQGNFTEDGISSLVNPFIPAITESHVEASQVLTKIADYAGADWGILNDDIFLRYPTMRHSGVIITDISDDLDLANRTSYCVGPVNYEDSMEQGDGFANVFILKGGVMQPDTGSTGVAGYTSLFQKDIAQRIQPMASRLRNLCVTFSRVGEGGKSARRFVEGAVVADATTTGPSNIAGDGGTVTSSPGGIKLMDLRIPLSSIPNTPTPVFDFNTKFSTHDVQVNQNYWLIFYAKGSSEQDTILWYHDNDFETEDRQPSAYRTVTMDPITEDRTDPNKADLGGWNINPTGPVYSHSFFSVVRSLSVVKDTASIEKYGRVEGMLTADWITDPITLQSYGAAVIQNTAKPVRRFSLSAVTIPNNYIFLPGDQVTIENQTAGITSDAQIQQVRYVFDSNSECRRAEISPFTYYDYLGDAF